MDEHNKVWGTAKRGLQSLISSTLYLSTQNRETLSLKIQDLNQALKAEKEHTKKEKLKTIKVANDIFEDVLKHRVNKLVNKADGVWETYKRIHDTNINICRFRRISKMNRVNGALEREP